MNCTQNSLRCLIYLVLLLCTSSSWAGEPNDINLPLPGEPFPFTFEGFDVVVQVPVDYNDLNETPLIFYYHGAGGRANVHYLAQMTESKGFILAGMTYTFGANGTVLLKRYTNHLKGEIKRVWRIKKHLEDELQLRIDDQQIFLGGISKGGWFTNDLFEIKPGLWAGALIIAAGRSQSTEMSASEKPIPLFKGKPVYIGVGENDVNRPAAERAKKYLRSVEADVTFEIYEGLGHAVDPESQLVRQWLKERLKPTTMQEK